jgi:hypothetical protein
MAREVVQLGVDERGEAFERPFVAVVPRDQKLSDLVRIGLIHMRAVGGRLGP